MKSYLAEKMFLQKDFPLSITHAKQRQAMVPHYHDFIEIVLVAQGHTIHNIHMQDGREVSYGLIQGDLFSILPYEVHGYSDSKNLVIYNVALHPELISAELPELSRLSSWETLFNPHPRKFRNRVHLLPFQRSGAEQCLKKAILALSMQRPGHRLSAKTQLLEFLLIAAHVEPVEWKADVDSINTHFFESLEELEAAPEKPFHLGKIARNAGMSVSGYTKKFREMTGLSPLDYCINLRIEHARKLLIETDISLSEIAGQTGFCDSNYLIKLFRLRHGITPSRYRRLITSSS